MHKWKASTGYIDAISRLLKSLVLSKSHAAITISPSGVKVSTQSPSKSYNAQLFLDMSLFATFDFQSDEDLKLMLSLKALVHCLQMFMEWSPSDDHIDASAGCFFEYSSENTFRMSFAYNTMTSTCDLTLYHPAGTYEEYDVEFNGDDVALQVIMPASVFAGVIRDLDAVAANEASFRVNLSPPRFEVRGIGDLASTEFMLPNEPNVLDAMAGETDETFSYDFRSLVKCRDAVRLAKKTSLRFDSSGVLSVQCLCEIDDHAAYIEFKFLSKV